jgi:hypothetical protein
MYSFLVLLPLTLITAAIGGVLIFSPQVRDYVDFIGTLDGSIDKTRLAIQLTAHIVTYAICCFVLVVTTRTIAAPVSRDRPDVLCRLQMALGAIFVAVPSLIILALATYSLVRRVDVAAGLLLAMAGQQLAGPSEALFWTFAGLGMVCLAAIILGGRPREMRRFGRALVGIIAGIPITLALGLVAGALPSGQVSPLLLVAAAVGAVGLALSVAAVVLVKRPLDLFQSTLSPIAITLPDAVAALALVASVGFGASLIWSPVEAASFLGMFPALFLVSSVALVVVAAVFAKGSSPVAVISIAISTMVVMHSLDFLTPTREFRYRSEIPLSLQSKLAGNAPLTISEVEKARNLPELREAFLEWLQVRREAIDAYRKKGKTYPVFVVAAQGGGVYAAYHSALSLSRLYDACPEIVDHMFVLSGVSGGALGSAVFTELVRSVPEQLRTKPGAAAEGCNPRAGAPKLEEKVKAFFAADFLSPVVDSALLFDFPSLLVPWLRFGMDRAYALEYAFEDAWHRMAKEKSNTQGKGKTGLPPPAFGLEANFYGRWTPAGPVPALFLGTTGVNSGVQVLVSQIKWARGQSLRLGDKAIAPGGEEELRELLRRARAQEEGTGSSVFANILDFRPDLQVNVSTAVALSARFPYITPPANLKRHARIEPPSGFYSDVKVLELLDGAYFDNSGGIVAIDLLDRLEQYVQPPAWALKKKAKAAEYEPFKEFADGVRFHLMRFTDRSAQRKLAASEDEHFELLTPLIAFNTVRSARGAQLRSIRRELDRTGETFFFLSDPWFTPSLNWLLSADTKAKIELRSKGKSTADDAVCCVMKRVLPPAATGAPKGRWLGREILLVATWEEAEKLNGHPDLQSDDPSDPLKQVMKFVPDNAEAFATVLRLVAGGDEAVAAPPASN